MRNAIRGRGARPARAVVAALALFSGLALATARPGPASAAVTPRHPVLVVGGHTTTIDDAPTSIQFVKTWLEQAGYAGQVEVMELARCTEDEGRPPEERTLVFPCPGVPADWPGTASNVDSALRIGRKVNEMLAAHPGAERVDIVGISQGAVAARFYLERFLEADAKVGGIFSWSGVNYGIPGTGVMGLVCSLVQIQVCKEMLYPVDPVTGVARPGDTPLLRAINEPVDVFPGHEHYHIYTDSDDAPARPAEIATLRGDPAAGLVAINVKVQDVCPGRRVAHANLADPVMQALLLKALQRQSADEMRTGVSCP